MTDAHPDLVVLRPPHATRKSDGKALRRACPLESHAELPLTSGRDPIGLLIGQSASRVPGLVPIRYRRMLVSPFIFYRGAAIVMAADLSRTPATGLRTQLCGDAHLSNFGAYASAERRLVFDLNDFDENSAGTFRVGREEAGREPGDRRPRQRLHREAGPERGAVRCAALPRSDA